MRRLLILAISYSMIFSPIMVQAEESGDQTPINFTETDSSYNSDDRDGGFSDSDVTDDNMKDLKDAKGLTQSQLDKNGDWIDGAHEILDKPVARLALRRLGTPGFMVSKYMNIRKLMNQPLCNLSEKLSWGGSMLNVVGDISSHVLKFIQERKLKKEFKEDKARIDEYMKSAKILSRESLGEEYKDVPLEKLDIHLLSLDYMLKYEKANLKYKNFRKKFSLPSKGLHLASSIVNASEMLAETSSVGTKVLADQNCRLAHMKKKLSIEQQQAVQTKMANRPDSVRKDVKSPSQRRWKAQENAPWYLKPFLWVGASLGDAGDWLKTSKVGEAIDTYRKQEKLDDKASRLTDSGSATDLAQGFNQAYSTNYVENALVEVVDRMREKSNWGQGKTKPLAKLGSRMATRYAVRTAIKGNEALVDKYMRTAAGRVAVYAFNIVITAKDVKQELESIKYSKEKIARIEELKKKVANDTVTFKHFDAEKFHFYFAKTLFNLIIDNAHARGQLEPEDRLLFCLGGGDSCQDKFVLYDKNVKNHLFSLPKDFQKKQLEFVKSSHIISNFNKVANGKAPITSFNQSIMKKEIEKYEKVNKKLMNELDKKNLIKKKKVESFIKFSNRSNTSFLDKLLPEDVNFENSNGVRISENLGSSSFLPNLSLKRIKANIKGEKMLKEKSSVSYMTKDMLEDDSELEESMSKTFKYSANFHEKSTSLWKAISMRYRKNYSKLKSLN